MTDMIQRLRFDGRVAFVTGAGAGIGQATSQALARLGATVCVTDLDGAAAEAVAARLRADGASAEAWALDVADEARADAVVAEALARFGRIDVLVSNAGIGARMPAVDLPTERWHRVLNVGLDGAFFLSRAVARHMLARGGGGAIVYVASIMGLCGGGLYPNVAYHTVKGALVNLTRALALEWAADGIRVNAVAPAFVKTALIEPLMADPKMADALIAATPMGRLLDPHEVADAIAFLASDAAAMVTGHTLPVDGGWLAR